VVLTLEPPPVVSSSGWPGNTTRIDCTRYGNADTAALHDMHAIIASAMRFHPYMYKLRKIAFTGGNTRADVCFGRARKKNIASRRGLRREHLPARLLHTLKSHVLRAL